MTPGTFDDLPDFETYLRIYGNTIGGHLFDIVGLTMDMTEYRHPRFVLEVAGSETNNVFAAQPATDVLDYESPLPRPRRAPLRRPALRDRSREHLHRSLQ